MNRARIPTRSALGAASLSIPVLAALLGPILAGSTRTESGPLRTPSPDHPLGTDILGRDVLALVLTGGGSVLLLVGSSLLLAYLLGVPLTLACVNPRRGWRAVWLVRVLDAVLALPGLLVLLALAATGEHGAVLLVVAVAGLQLPAIVRLVRGAALAPGTRQTIEAMLMQGEPWWRIRIGYLGRTVCGPTVIDAASRATAVLYLVSSANFLGLGLDPASADWAVLVERNQQALFVQPWAVLVPAMLLIALCTGVHLVADDALARTREVRW